MTRFYAGNSQERIEEFLVEDLSYTEREDMGSNEENIRVYEEWNKYIKQQFTNGVTRQWLVFAAVETEQENGKIAVSEGRRLFAGKARSVRHAIEKSNAEARETVFVYKIKLEESQSDYYLHRVISKDIGAYIVPE